MVTNALQCRMFSKTEKVHRGKTNWPSMAGSVNVTNECGNFSKTKNGKLVDPVWPDCNSANYLCGNFSNFHCHKRLIQAFLGIKWIKTKIDMFPQIQVGQGQLIAVAVLLTKPSESLRVSRVTLSDIGHSCYTSLLVSNTNTNSKSSNLVWHSSATVVTKMQLFKNKTRLQNANCISIFVAFLPCINMWI